MLHELASRNLLGLAAPQPGVPGEAGQGPEPRPAADARLGHRALAVEDGGVDHQVAANPLDPGPADALGERLDARDRHVVTAREAGLRERRVAIADQHQAALQDLVVASPARTALPDRGLELAVGAEAVEVRRGGEQLRVRRQHPAALAGVRIENAAAPAARTQVVHPGAAAAADTIHLALELAPEPPLRERATSRERGPPCGDRRRAAVVRHRGWGRRHACGGALSRSDRGRDGQGRHYPCQGERPHAAHDTRSRPRPNPRWNVCSGRPAILDA